MNDAPTARKKTMLLSGVITGLQASSFCCEYRPSLGRFELVAAILMVLGRLSAVGGTQAGALDRHTCRRCVRPEESTSAV